MLGELTALPRWTLWLDLIVRFMAKGGRGGNGRKEKRRGRRGEEGREEGKEKRIVPHLSHPSCAPACMSQTLAFITYDILYTSVSISSVVYILWFYYGNFIMCSRLLYIRYYVLFKKLYLYLKQLKSSQIVRNGKDFL